MDSVLDTVESRIVILEKVVKSKSTKTVSDKPTRKLLQELAKEWHGQIKPIIDKYLPKSDQLYDLENTIDRLVDYSTYTSVRKDVLKDVRSLLRGFQKHIKASMIKYASGAATGSTQKGLINPENFSSLRGYLSETIRQINICYQYLCPDACALLLRKLVECMLYDYYKIQERESDVCDSQGRWKQLKTIINHFIDLSGARPSDPLREFLKNTRVFGGTAAHNARVTLIQDDIDKLTATGEIVLRELHTIVYSKK